MTGKHPRLHSTVKRRKSGRVVTYYRYDMRPEGKPDIQLGTDYAAALARWHAIHVEKISTAGTIEEAMSRWESEVLAEYTSAVTRADYAKHLRRIRPVFGPASWDSVGLPDLVEYLRRRTGKTQANRELAVLALVWKAARLWGLTKLPWPAAGMERSGWKNRERAREVEVSDDAFAAIHAAADQVLRDCMDLASATGLRLTDCRTVQLPRGDVLTIRASKTGKRADIDINQSGVLPGLIERRRGVPALHTMLLTTEDGKPITPAMLRRRWDLARDAAADAAQAAGRGDLADDIRGLYLRDMRKRAAALASSTQAASELLQHSSPSVTVRHYRQAGNKLKPSR